MEHNMDPTTQMRWVGIHMWGGMVHILQTWVGTESGRLERPER